MTTSETTINANVEKQAAHTPGPWYDGVYHAVRDGGRTYAYIRAPKQLVPIAAVPLGVEGYGHEEGEANARLIAAAPDMLEACSDLLKMVEAAHRQLGMWTGDNPRILSARAAIAKATGGK